MPTNAPAEQLQHGTHVLVQAGAVAQKHKAAA
jgi:hypothetical protein